MSLWSLATLLLWFRPRVEIFWKLVATLILAFHGWFFFEDITAGLSTFTAAWYTSLFEFVKESAILLFINLFYLWPVILVVIFYKADDIGAEKLLKFICLLTLVLWILFLVYLHFSKGIDSFFYENLKKMIPNAK